MDEQRKYIDAEELKKRAYLVCGAEYYETPQFLAVAVETIDRIPAADVQLVKRGRWQLLSANMNTLTEDYECSNCLGILCDVSMDKDENHTLPKYCCMCGAIMSE